MRLLTYIQTHEPPWMILALILFAGNFMVVSLLSIIGVVFVGTAYTDPSKFPEAISNLAESGITEEWFVALFDTVSDWILIQAALFTIFLIWGLYKILWERRHSKKEAD